MKLKAENENETKGRIRNKNEIAIRSRKCEKNITYKEQYTHSVPNMSLSLLTVLSLGENNFFLSACNLRNICWFPLQLLNIISVLDLFKYLVSQCYIHRCCLELEIPRVCSQFSLYPCIIFFSLQASSHFFLNCYLLCNMFSSIF